MEWLTNLSLAIQYIEEHLDKEISYDEAARIACCSTYYFQRMFTYVAGISLGEYIRRRRMTQAAFALQQTNQKVLDIALTYGYRSPTSFNRAFQQVHGISPMAAKRVGMTLHAYPPIKFSVKVSGSEAFAYRIEHKEAMRLVGIRTTLTMDMEENHRNVPIFWEETLTGETWSQLCQMKQTQPQGIIGASVYQDDSHMYYYIAAATDEDASADMEVCIIPEADWVIFENEGSFKETVQYIFQHFYTQWLPFSGYVYAGLPDIEIYPIYDEQGGKGHSEVWIAIKKEEKKTNGISN